MSAREPSLPTGGSDAPSRFLIRGGSVLTMDPALSWAPGMDADGIVVGTSAVGMFPVNNPIGTLIYGTRASDVRDVFVRGFRVKGNGVLVGTDLGRLRRLAEEARDQIIQGTGFEPGFDWRISSTEWSAPDT